ncbi:hypothetical protein Tco_0821053 [Tanacetum coccineum]|uniref:Uncharacterized protein n=1 Tax=Tanacetum coccineum TaxID=301880 RepID=A0ABQ5ACW3_9ASTR
MGYVTQAISGKMSNPVALPTSYSVRAYMMKLTLIAERQGRPPNEYHHPIFLLGNHFGGTSCDSWNLAMSLFFHRRFLHNFYIVSIFGSSFLGLYTSVISFISPLHDKAYAASVPMIADVKQKQSSIFSLRPYQTNPESKPDPFQFDTPSVPLKLVG